MVIDRTLYERMVRQLVDAFPDEGCGLISVKDGIATDVFPIANVSQSPVVFKMDPQQQLDALERIDEEGWELGAIYHSHPRTRAYPSRTDVELAFYPDALQIIVSLAAYPRPDVHAFRIVAGEVSEEPLEIIPAAPAGE
ncbi:MAG TPA: M67 family metallopeptidase [Chloroflexota bacterium]|nr:M67 family metallopeptidase [Chloroflexota bacterium]